MTTTIPALAEIARSFLYRSDRLAEGIGQTLLTRTNAPKWLTDLCRRAHAGGHMLPDDWRYEFIGDALNVISEAEPDAEDSDLVEAFEQWFDGAYVYTAEQTAWLASHVERPGYCDEAMTELGMEDYDIMRMIALGMMHEAREVFASVLQSLRDQLDEEAMGEPLRPNDEVR